MTIKVVRIYYDCSINIEPLRWDEWFSIPTREEIVRDRAGEEWYRDIITLGHREAYCVIYALAPIHDPIEALLKPDVWRTAS